MRRTIIGTMALVAGAQLLSAQSPRAKPEIRPFAGAYLPTGPQRDLFKDAPLFGVQGAMELKPTLHLLGSFSWVPGQNRYQVSNHGVNIYAYDIGMEVGMVQAVNDGWEL